MYHLKLLNCNCSIVCDRSSVDQVTSRNVERASRSEAADRLAADFARRLKGVAQVRLSQVEATAPEAIVMALAEELAPHLDTLLPAPV